MADRIKQVMTRDPITIAGTDIPGQVLIVIPYVATLIVMIFAFRWARVPQFLGRNYDRESRTG